MIRGTFAGIPLERLARRHGTPFYAYDLDAIADRAALLRAALPSTVDPAFALKANPSLGVVANLGAAGLGMDVASAGELAIALRAGVPADRIVMTGPGKRDGELRAAVDAGIRAVTVESPGELARLERIAAAAGRRQSVLLRLAVAPGVGRPPGAAGGGGAIAIGGRRGHGAQFGMRLADLRTAYRAAAASPHLDPLGLHAFALSNVRDAAVLAAHVGRTLAIARRAAREVGADLRVVDGGGGLGIPYVDGQAPLDLPALGRAIARILARDAARHRDAPPVRIILEPGRWLTGPTGVYVASVVDVKTGSGETIAVLDGGIHHLLRPALVGEAHRVEVLRAGDAPPRTRRLTLAGPLCTGLDVLATLERAPMPRPGDLVVVRDAGAYGFSESMPFFLSHPTPAEIGISGGRDRVLRPRLVPERWTGPQRLPGPGPRAASRSRARGQSSGRPPARPAA